MRITSETVDILKGGGVGVLPTDTIYGLVGSALNPKTVRRIYKIRKRNLKKPLIILISSLRDLAKFDISLGVEDKKLIKRFWPGPVSIIFRCSIKELEYLHRGKKSLAFRLPKDRILCDLIKKTGPLVAPSANPEGSPSRIIKILRGRIKFLR